MQMLTLIDLDDTLFQTRLKCPPGETLETAVLARDGSPLSFSTPRQRALLDGFFARGSVIPVTARNLDAFRRVRLPFTSFAILNFGGSLLLPDGSVDSVWDERLRPLIEPLHDEMTAIAATMLRLAPVIRTRTIAEFGRTLYVVAKHPGNDIAALNALQHAIIPELDTSRFFIHANDNNLSIVPRVLGKEKCVAYLFEQHLRREEWLVVGVADSLSDAPFLGLCDYCVLPRRSQLFEQTLARLEGH